jgi:hypothetical protein
MAIGGGVDVRYLIGNPVGASGMDAGILTRLTTAQQVQGTTIGYVIVTHSSISHF